MEETVGTLNLKIARLEQKLQLLQKQRLLSRPYPDHLAHLLLQDFQARALLQNLLEYRAQVLNFPRSPGTGDVPKSPYLDKFYEGEATLAGVS